MHDHSLIASSKPETSGSAIVGYSLALLVELDWGDRSRSHAVHVNLARSIRKTVEEKRRRETVDVKRPGEA